MAPLQMRIHITNRGAGDGFHTYGWDADVNLITVDGVTGVFDALDRRAELGSAGYDQTLYGPSALRHPMGLATALTSAGIRLPIPGGGEVAFGSTGISQYRDPNWQGSQVLLSFTTQTTPTVGGAYSPFGEKYASYSGGANGYFAGMLGIADEGPINDAYQAEARLMHQAEGRWVSPDPAGMGAVDLTNPQTLNRYGYVANDPLNNIDPSGLLAPAPAPPPLLPPIQPWQIGGAPIPLCNPASDWSYTGTPGQTPCNPVLIQPGGPILIAQNGGGVGGAVKGKCLGNVGSFVNRYQANAQTLASSLGNGVTAAEVLAVAGNESTYGTSSFAAFGNFFGLHGNGPAGTHYSTQNHTPVMMFPVQNGFMASGQVFVSRATPYLTPGIGASPLAFFNALNKSGLYANGNAGYASFMVGTKPRGPYALVSACMAGQ